MTAAGRSSNGCASIAGGSIHCTPWVASGTVRKNGDAAAMGWTAEQMSCRQPGRVNAAVRHPPPIVGAASKTFTRSPALARTMAADRPLGPAPTTTASSWLETVTHPPWRKLCRPSTQDHGLAADSYHLPESPVWQHGGVDPRRD